MRDLSGRSRRNFFKGCLGSAVCAALQAPAQPVLAPKSRVVVAHDPDLRGAGAAIDPNRLEALLDRAILALARTCHAEIETEHSRRVASHCRP